MKREAYLINRSFWHYVTAAILSMSAMNLKSVVDGILMGNLLGADALSAINVVMPLVNCLGMVGTLFAQGSAIRIAKFLGARENDQANQAYTVSVVSMLAVSILLTVIFVAGNLVAPVAEILSVEPNLLGLVQKYAGVLMAGCILLIFENGLSILVNVMGNPKIVTVAMTASMMVNILFDIVNVKVFGMDISGAAYATLMGALAGIAIFAVYLARYNGVKLCKCPQWFSEFFSGILSSLPGLIGQMAAVALMFICNYFVMLHQGADGMFVMSIGYCLISIGSMFSNAVGMSYAAIGGMLIGQEDSDGIRALFRLGMFVTVLVAVLFNLAGLFSRSLAVAFGAETQSLISLAEYALPLCCTLLFSLGVISSMVYLHTVLGQGVVATLNSIMVLACVMGSFLAADRLLPSPKIWMAFPMASLSSLLLFLAVIMITRWKSGGSLQWISLIPRRTTDRFDVSVRCDMKEREDAINLLLEYLRGHGAGAFESPVVHCIDELMMNIITFSGSGKDSYIDLIVTVKDDKVSASIRSSGKPFDPTKVKEEDKSFGLKIVSHYCRKLEYQYFYGQNMIFAAWNNDDIQKGNMI